MLADFAVRRSAPFSEVARLVVLSLPWIVVLDAADGVPPRRPRRPRPAQHGLGARGPALLRRRTRGRSTAPCSARPAAASVLVLFLYNVVLPPRQRGAPDLHGPGRQPPRSSTSSRPARSASPGRASPSSSTARPRTVARSKACSCASATTPRPPQPDHRRPAGRPALEGDRLWLDLFQSTVHELDPPRPVARPVEPERDAAAAPRRRHVDPARRDRVRVQRGLRSQTLPELWQRRARQSVATPKAAASPGSRSTRSSRSRSRASRSRSSAFPWPRRCGAAGAGAASPSRSPSCSATTFSSRAARPGPRRAACRRPSRCGSPTCCSSPSASARRSGGRLGRAPHAPRPPIAEPRRTGPRSLRADPGLPPAPAPRPRPDLAPSTGTCSRGFSRRSPSSSPRRSCWRSSSTTPTSSTRSRGTTRPPASSSATTATSSSRSPFRSRRSPCCSRRSSASACSRRTPRTRHSRPRASRSCRLAVPVFVAAGFSRCLAFAVGEYVLPLAEQRQARFRNVIYGRPPDYGIRTSAERNWYLARDGRIWFREESVAVEQRPARRRHLPPRSRTYPLSERHRRPRGRSGAAAAGRCGTAGPAPCAGTASCPTARFAEDGRRRAIRPASVVATRRRPEEMRFRELERLTRHLRAGGYPTAASRRRSRSKLAQPALLPIMVLLAVPFAFRVGRRGALAGIGVGLGLGVLHAWSRRPSSPSSAKSARCRRALAAWSPDVIFGLAAAYFLVADPHVRPAARGPSPFGSSCATRLARARRRAARPRIPPPPPPSRPSSGRRSPKRRNATFATARPW